MCARKSKAACGACEIAQYADGRGARNQRVEKDLKATHPPDASVMYRNYLLPRRFERDKKAPTLIHSIRLL